eukprot:CAMPEP_0178440864 /NCGR_PEP_ID=MMETSP0689_2-20121128/37076_1 /TAXON_ID=160604 /ORGANISM="Amphidinium massartii, Strain CS-259" /LENGTH=66 /DNA_ID=CAMNT_0020063807 /DNA_START=36 /DNA_END=233 /DNA_ORIENTATION=+
MSAGKMSQEQSFLSEASTDANLSSEAFASVKSDCSCYQDMASVSDSESESEPECPPAPRGKQVRNT